MSHGEVGFVPLTTFQGCSGKELEAILGRKALYIWGGGHLGKVVKKVLGGFGFHDIAICDRDPLLVGRNVDGALVVSPSEAVAQAKNKTAVIIIASIHHRNDMKLFCESEGLVYKEDFISYVQIPRPEAAIDVSGTCNIQCVSCPRGNMQEHSEGFMSLDTFRNVLDKLLREIPHLSHIDLSTWGEPLLNPDLADIIEYSEQFVPCSISTNLLNINGLEKVLSSKPSQFVVSVSGFEASYESNHTGSCWNTFKDNLTRLSQYVAKEEYQKTECRVVYHLYRDNQGEDLAKFKKLCKELKLKLILSDAYLNPYEHFLDHCNGKRIPDEASSVLGKLPWNLSHALELSRQDAEQPCLCQRIFPVINWDLTVAQCHLYYKSSVSPNYLDISLPELLEKRHTAELCRDCQAHGLHRLDIDVLKERHPLECDNLINKTSILEIKNA